MCLEWYLCTVTFADPQKGVKVLVLSPRLEVFKARCLSRDIIRRRDEAEGAKEKVEEAHPGKRSNKNNAGLRFIHIVAVQNFS